MQIIDVPTPVFLQRAKDHEKIQRPILDILNSGKIRGSLGNGESIYNTDYYLADRFKADKARDYWELMLPSVNAHYDQISELTGLKNRHFQGCWFQTYQYNDFHSMHVHANCMFSNVYYVTLPEGSSKTVLKYFDREFEIDVKEGDILTFPGLILHGSNPHRSNTPKNIIAFNSNLT